MSNRALMIALAVSLALNLFAVAAGVTAWVSREAAEDRVEEVRSSRERMPLMAVIDTIDPDRRGPVRAELRAAALSAKPDFQEAREARRQAIALTESEDFDPAAVSALLEQSRASELRGRARLEVEAVRILSELSPEDRARMSTLLRRHNRHRSRDGDNRTEPTPAPAPAE
ncbi:periplasmic heavy metal sensor [Brevundimonas sp. BAL450]|jgi:uncharacterized membrane protein|nr:MULTISPECIES: periplasmic heavy metal sensor [Brevundimonas]MBG7615420.1 periplasmic heavy metal sensor [Brevundimonas sp. BAL450]